MSSIKLKVNEPRKDGKVSVSLELIHNRQRKIIPLPEISIMANHFDFALQRCKPEHPHFIQINNLLNEKRSLAESVFYEPGIKDMGCDSLVNLIQRKLLTGGLPITLKTLVKELVAEQRAIKSEGNARLYECHLNIFLTYLGKDVPMTEITYNTLHSFKIYKQANSVSSTTIAMYLSSLRVFFNVAIRKKYISKDAYPFERGLIPQKKKGTGKDYDIEIIRLLVKLRPSLKGNERLVVNALLLQFYMQGADIIDVALRKKSEIKKGYVSFHRFKNRNRGSNDKNNLVTIKLLPQALEIINENPGENFIPLMEGISIIDNILLFTHRKNNLQRALNVLCKREGIKQMGFKPMRHTWGTVAANKPLLISREIYMKAMGHTSHEMSDNYVRFDQSLMDDTNLKVYNYLHS